MLFEDLKAFVAVVESESLTKAAERLCLTQSAVSRRIQHLEETLGASLFDRSTRPPIPSALGYRIFEEGLKLLEGARNLVRIGKEESPPSGHFRVGFTQLVSDAVVCDTLIKIRDAFPDLEVQLVTRWGSELESLLSRAELDSALLLLPAPSTLPEKMKGQLISSLKMVVVQSKRKPLVLLPVTLADLSCREWILNPKGCGYRAALEAALGVRGSSLKLGIDTHATSVQMLMVEAGLGLGLLPERVLTKSPHAKDLTVVTLNDFSLQMDVWIAYPSEPGNLRQAIELVIGAVSADFAS